MIRRILSCLCNNAYRLIIPGSFASEKIEGEIAFIIIYLFIYLVS